MRNEKKIESILELLDMTNHDSNMHFWSTPKKVSEKRKSSEAFRHLKTTVSVDNKKRQSWHKMGRQRNKFF